MIDPSIEMLYGDLPAEQRLMEALAPLGELLEDDRALCVQIGYAGSTGVVGCGEDTGKILVFNDQHGNGPNAFQAEDRENIRFITSALVIVDSAVPHSAKIKWLSEIVRERNHVMIVLTTAVGAERWRMSLPKWMLLR